MRGRALMLSRDALALPAGTLAGLLAHELGHLATLDGRLTPRRCHGSYCGADPLGPPRTSLEPAGAPGFVACSTPSGSPGAGRGWWLRALVWIAGGGLGLRHW